MTIRRRVQYVQIVTLWLLGSVLLLVVLDSLRVDVLVVVALIGILLAAEATAPVYITPRWRKKLKTVISLGILLFAILAAYRLVTILIVVV